MPVSLSFDRGIGDNRDAVTSCPGGPGTLLDPRGWADVAELEPAISFLDLDGDAFDGRTGNDEHFIIGLENQIWFFHKGLQACLGSRAFPQLRLKSFFATAREADGDFGLHCYLLVLGSVLKS